MYGSYIGLVTNILIVFIQSHSIQGVSVVLADFQCKLNGKSARSTETPCMYT